MWRAFILCYVHKSHTHIGCDLSVRVSQCLLLPIVTRVLARSDNGSSLAGMSRYLRKAMSASHVIV